jgi:pimeloyl-ACP methyl ester carboxylesterase
VRPTFEPAPPLPGWIRKKLHFERRAVRIDGAMQSFVDHGPERGRVVLLVHGNPTWSFLWRRVIGALDGSGFRVIAPDLLGFGASDKPASPGFHQLATHVDRTARLLEALGVDRFIAVGQDWGGPIAAGCAERLSDRFGGFVFGNTAVLAPARPLRPKAFHRFAHVPIVSDALFRGAMFPLWLIHRSQGDPSSMSFSARAAYAWPFRHLRDRAGPIGLARMVPGSEEHPSTREMDRIGAFVEAWRGPAALVWGKRDPVLGRSLRRHAAALPQASVRESEAGHFLQEEVPELFAEAIREVSAKIG